MWRNNPRYRHGSMYAVDCERDFCRAGCTGTAKTSEGEMSDFYEEQYNKTHDKLCKQYEKQGSIISLCKMGLGLSEPYFKKDPVHALREILQLVNGGK